MTTLVKITATCAVCERPSEHTGVASTNTQDQPDLDGRPAEMQRSTLPHWIQQCPGCGYAAEEISELRDPRIREIVTSPEFQTGRRNAAIPEGAWKFVAAAKIEEALRDFPRAFQRHLWAAWMCDDAESEKASSACRRQALLAAEAASRENVLLAEDPAHAAVLVADVARRVGEFNYVEALCLKMTPRVRPHFRRLLEGELRFARAADRGLHTMGDCRPAPIPLGHFFEHLRPRLQEALGPLVRLERLFVSVENLAHERELLRLMAEELQNEGRVLPIEQLMRGIDEAEKFRGLAHADPGPLTDALLRLASSIANNLTQPAVLRPLIRQESREVKLTLSLHAAPGASAAPPSPFAPFAESELPETDSFLDILPDAAGWAFSFEENEAPALRICFVNGWHGGGAP